MRSRQRQLPAKTDADRKVAAYLGLSRDEYAALEPVVAVRVGDDGLVISYSVHFGRSVSAAISAKAPRLAQGRAELPPGFFDAADAVPEWPQG
jgi:hypothetical protein